MRIYERLRWILSYYYEHKYVRGFLNKVTNKMKVSFLEEFLKSKTYRVFDRNEEKLHEPTEYSLTENKQKKEMNLKRDGALKRKAKHLMHKLVKA
jgi:hypothetical protein